MAALGPGRLRDAEVLAVLIGSGHRGCSSLALADRLLKKFRGPAGLAAATAQDLQRVPGVGPALSLRITAARELALRAHRRSALRTPDYQSRGAGPGALAAGEGDNVAREPGGEYAAGIGPPA